MRLRPWNRRIRKSMGYDGDGRPAPLIDQVHRLMHLWKAGDLIRVDEYLDARGLRRNALFHQLLQALIELAPGRQRGALPAGKHQQPHRRPPGDGGGPPGGYMFRIKEA